MASDSISINDNSEVTEIDYVSSGDNIQYDNNHNGSGKIDAFNVGEELLKIAVINVGGLRGKMKFPDLSSSSDKMI